MSARLALLAAAGMVAASTAQASVITYVPITALALSSTPITINLAGATYSFTAADTGSGIGAAVSTAGTGLVSQFLGGLSDFEAGATIDGAGLYSFAAFPTETLIPYSSADDFIGLAYALTDGIHYGYAEVDGPALISYAVETTADVGITTASAIPEPASFAVLGLGLLGLVGAARRFI